MRIGILTHSINAAMRIMARIDPRHEVFVLLCNPGEPEVTAFGKHAARLILKPDRFAAIKSLLKGRIHHFSKPLHDDASLKKLRVLNLDVGLHKTGLIYRQPTIDAFRLGILNAHIGLLPEYRGRAVVEWSLVEGKPTGVTVFFIDTGIDTGERIVIREERSVSHCNSIAEAKEYLFGLDAELFARAVEMVDDPTFEYEKNEGGRRYYVMSKLLTDAANEILTQ
jgi:methionyl-tRNA formyltransferase